MGSNSGIRVSRDDLSTTLTLYAKALPLATQAGVENAMDAGAAVMAKVLKAATTATGLREHPSHPGRQVTNQLLDSIIDPLNGEAGGGMYRLNANRNGNMNYTFGFLDPENPPWTAAQELGTMGRSGRGSGIPPMLSLQSGINTVFQLIQQDIAAELEKAGHDAEAGRLYQKSKNGVRR